jgi:putative mRNA 3-end processing factor
MRPEDILVPTPAGVCCKLGGFYIDPTRPVERALITHAHSDHARAGHGAVLATRETLDLMRLRYGENFAGTTQAAAYGESTDLGGVTVTFHPAGHVLGSAQARVEHRGDVWVASGDYKVEADGVVAAFEAQRCRVFITESTFGLPIYRWRPQAELAAEINSWWRENAAAGRASVIYAYALGKAQRLIGIVDASIGPIVCHGAVEAITQLYREQGVALPPTRVAEDIDKAEALTALVVAPPSAAGSPWLRRFGEHSDAMASGWMQVRGNRRRRGLDRGFALSDHADWPGLLAAIDAAGAERVLATHGPSESLTRYLREQGRDAATLATGYGDDEDTVEAAA